MSDENETYNQAPEGLLYFVNDGYPQCSRCGEIVRGRAERLEHIKRHMEIER